MRKTRDPRWWVTSPWTSSMKSCRPSRIPLPFQRWAVILPFGFHSVIKWSNPLCNRADNRNDSGFVTLSYRGHIASRSWALSSNYFLRLWKYDAKYAKWPHWNLAPNCTTVPSLMLLWKTIHLTFGTYNLDYSHLNPLACEYSFFSRCNRYKAEQRTYIWRHFNVSLLA